MSSCTFISAKADTTTIGYTPTKFVLSENAPIEPLEEEEDSDDDEYDHLYSLDLGRPTTTNLKQDQSTPTSTSIKSLDNELPLEPVTTGAEEEINIMVNRFKAQRRNDESTDQLLERVRSDLVSSSSEHLEWFDQNVRNRQKTPPPKQFREITLKLSDKDIYHYLQDVIQDLKVANDSWAGLCYFHKNMIVERKRKNLDGRGACNWALIPIANNAIPSSELNAWVPTLYLTTSEGANFELEERAVEISEDMLDNISWREEEQSEREAIRQMYRERSSKQETWTEAAVREEREERCAAFWEECRMADLAIWGLAYPKYGNTVEIIFEKDSDSYDDAEVKTKRIAEVLDSEWDSDTDSGPLNHELDEEESKDDEDTRSTEYSSINLDKALASTQEHRQQQEEPSPTLPFPPPLPGWLTSPVKGTSWADQVDEEEANASASD